MPLSPRQLPTRSILSDILPVYTKRDPHPTPM
jgi:hypothetical protein